MDAVTNASGRTLRAAILCTALFLALMLLLAVSINLKSAAELEGLLEESIRARLVASTLHARDAVDVVRFSGYTDAQSVQADRGAFGRTLTRLRMMTHELDVDAIYALKKIDGAYYAVLDTDLKDTSLFKPFTPSPVHLAAFSGETAAEPRDGAGTRWTAALPLWKDGQVAGVICTDVTSPLLAQSGAAVRRNTLLLAGLLLLTAAAFVAVSVTLLRRMNTMQRALSQLAHYDPVTGLPNRQYLLSYLQSITGGESPQPFALFFIDLDNFKAVNDGAGHDAGDALLRQIALYLSTAAMDTKTFRPAAGRLNITARIGGDEFIDIVPGISTAAEAEATARQILEGFRARCQSRLISKYNVGLSIGAALFPYHTSDFHVLIQYADAAMYCAKRAGKKQYRLYEDEMHE